MIIGETGDIAVPPPGARLPRGCSRSSFYEPVVLSEAPVNIHGRPDVGGAISRYEEIDGPWIIHCIVFLHI